LARESRPDPRLCLRESEKEYKRKGEKEKAKFAPTRRPNDSLEGKGLLAAEDGKESAEVREKKMVERRHRRRQFQDKLHLSTPKTSLVAKKNSVETYQQMKVSDTLRYNVDSDLKLKVH